MSALPRTWSATTPAYFSWRLGGSSDVPWLRHESSLSELVRGAGGVSTVTAPADPDPTLRSNAPWEDNRSRSGCRIAYRDTDTNGGGVGAIAV
jgi:hypothetical protein